MKVVISGSFDDLRYTHIRFLQEAANFGEVSVLLWSDLLVKYLTSKPPKLPQSERLYFLQAIRYLTDIKIIDTIEPDSLPTMATNNYKAWIVTQGQDNQAKESFCKANNMGYHIIKDTVLKDIAPQNEERVIQDTRNKKVLVTGCFDWFHSGHVRFLEEAYEFGDLYAVVGHDANIASLKGPDHPMFNENQRRYTLGSIKYVTQAFISTGNGWLDAEPEIKIIKPDIYVVNEDGNKELKKQFCIKHGIEYKVLKRLPKEGLTKRTSTKLRGF